MLEITRLIENASYVYLVGEEDEGCVKIGVAKDPIDRLRGMQTGNPRRLKIERLLLGDMEMEKLLHEMWEPFAVVCAANRGKVDRAPLTEWFNPGIREKLMPIIAEATALQMEYLSEKFGPDRPVEMAELDRRVRQAHADHGYTPAPREQVRFLAPTMGYVTTSRRTRI